MTPISFPSRFSHQIPFRFSSGTSKSLAFDASSFCSSGAFSSRSRRMPAPCRRPIQANVGVLQRKGNLEKIGKNMWKKHMFVHFFDQFRMILAHFGMMNHDLPWFIISRHHVSGLPDRGRLSWRSETIQWISPMWKAKLDTHLGQRRRSPWQTPQQHPKQNPSGSTTWGQREGGWKLVGVWAMEERDIAKMNPDHPRDGKNQIREHKELNCDKLRDM